MMSTLRNSTRSRSAPVRFEDECFKPGANNKYTKGRVIDAGKEAKVELDERHVGDFREVDTDFVVEDSEVQEAEPKSEDSESEEKDDQDESEEEDEENEWDSEQESEEEEDDRFHWGEKYPLPKDTYTYTLKGGIYSYFCYVRNIDGAFVVTLPDWLEECPENIDCDNEWRGNMVGTLNGVTIPEDNQQKNILGDFVEEKGWHNVQLPMSFACDDE